MRPGRRAAMVMLVMLGAAGPQEAPRLWLAPLHAGPSSGPSGAADYDDIFSRRAGWPRAGAAVRVFKVYPDLIDHADDARLRALFAGVEAAGMALAVETPVLGHAFGCADAADGAPWVVALFARIKALGGTPRYLAMNGPWVGGTTGPQVAGCRHSMAAVAADLAATVRGVRALFPAIAVGDIEPVGTPIDPDWPHVAEWLAVLAGALGGPAEFLHLDVTWEGPGWRERLPAIERGARQAGVQLGGIYIGTGRELSDAEDAASVADHAAAFEAALGHAPDDVLFQTWFAHPSHVLPETDPGSLTGHLVDYLRAPAALAAEGARARLTSGGRPLARRRVLVQEAPEEPMPMVIAGVLPPSARMARLALRVNTECGCADHAAALVVAHARLEQPGAAPATLSWGQASDAPHVGPAGVLVAADADRVELSLAADAKLILNGTQVPVRGGAPFVWRYDWLASFAAEGGGNLDLILSGNNGREMLRRVVPFAPAWQTTLTLTTDDDGVLLLPPARARRDGADPAYGGGRRLLFEGDTRYKPALLEMER